MATSVLCKKMGVVHRDLNDIANIGLEMLNCLWFVGIKLFFNVAQQKIVNGVKSQLLGGQLTSAWWLIKQPLKVWSNETTVACDKVATKHCSLHYHEELNGYHDAIGVSNYVSAPQTTPMGTLISVRPHVGILSTKNCNFTY